MILKRFNAILSGCSGVIGDNAVRQRKERTIVTKRPCERGAPVKEAQIATNNRFKLANDYAGTALADPALYAAYKQAADRAEKLVHARNMAVADYYNPPVIQKVGTQFYTGLPGGKIVILAKDDFRIKNVTVAIYDSRNQLLETGHAVSRGGDKAYEVFDYITTADGKGVRVMVYVADYPGNVTTEEVFTGYMETCEDDFVTFAPVSHPKQLAGKAAPTVSEKAGKPLLSKDPDVQGSDTTAAETGDEAGTTLFYNIENSHTLPVVNPTPTMYNKLLLTALLLSGSLASKAQQFVAKAGSEGYYRIESENSQSGGMKSSDTWKLKVKAVNDTLLELTCTLLQRTCTSPYQLFSTSDTLLDGVSSQDIEMLALLNKPFTYYLHNPVTAGQPGVSGLFKEAVTNWSLGEQYDKIFQGNAAYYYSANFQSLFPSLPSTLAALPANFLSKDSSNYTVVTKEKNSTLLVRTLPKDKQLGFKNTIRINNTDGMVLTAVQQQSFEADGKTQNISSRITRIDEPRFPVLSEDLKAAAVIGSRYSYQLMDGYQYDSAKMETYFAKYDPMFAEHNFYKISKAAIIQSSNITDLNARYKRYNALIVTIPDEAIANSPIILFNKLQETKDTDAEASYKTLTYLAKYPDQLSSWVQHTFAQSFRSMPDTTDMRKILKERGLSDADIKRIIDKGMQSPRTAQKLVAMMAKSKDTAVRNEVYPLYLWNEAKLHAGNKDSVLKIVSELEKIAGKKQGNSHRYALLVYKDLKANVDSKAAASLLDKHVAAMEKRVADTADMKRFGDQNILAYAYKLKSEAAADSGTAVKYLAKAAYYSPKSIAEKEHGSFYDRVMLDSKESYRADFAQALMKQGNSVEAMKILSQQLTSDPSMLQDMQQAFAQNFPDRNFADFFNDVVVKSWKAVPDFALAGPNGNGSFKLADYKGKWLLLDFWGTWCDPCRRELPQINKYAMSIKDSPDRAFLSIACHDNDQAVTTFLTKNNYQFPAAMSDRKVEGAYAVKGYPSKVLISPAGTMLEIPFGSDWEKIANEYSAIKPKQAADKTAVKTGKEL
ncbi:TlpA disulfide reductase family protein [uncultured Chitinophaga sp.]|uniref:TlpA family protein disulfide reductase n=1 Tax=uncultured Chitinophaga sp. TaxID=339340 RepID=UPI0025E229F8|nr:TlpA disulfide reductase family protein [uncultured Chitinophaga sp.]